MGDLRSEETVLYAARWTKPGGYEGCTLQVLMPEKEGEDTRGREIGTVYADGELFSKLEEVPGRYLLSYSVLTGKKQNGRLRIEDAEFLGGVSLWAFSRTGFTPAVPEGVPYGRFETSEGWCG